MATRGAGSTPDGTRMGRESMNLRGQVVEVDSSGKPGKDGMPSTMTIRGVTPQGDAAETFTIVGGTARWKSPIDAGSASYSGPAFYASQGGPIDTNAWFLEALLATPDKTLNLLPGGKAHAAKMTDLQIGTRRRGADDHAVGSHRYQHVAGADVGGREQQILRDDVRSRWLPEAYAGEQKKIEAAQADAVAKQAPALLKTLVTVPAAPVAFTGVQLFDADAMRFVADQTVVIDKGVIAAVGASRFGVSAGRRAGDRRARQDVDPGPVGLPHARRRRLYRAARAVDGRHVGARPWQRRRAHDRSPDARRRRRPFVPARLCIVTHRRQEVRIPRRWRMSRRARPRRSRSWTRRKANGFTGIKFYGTLNPAWLPASIAEAHKLGLHVHGHIPAGIRPLDAIKDGYDELTHINWVIMQAMPDSVIAASNGIMRFEGPGRYGKDVDLDGAAMKEIVATMAAKHIYSDPTMVAFESLYVPENGDLSPSYAPFVGTLPPTTERGFRSGGFAVPKDLTRADYRASWAKMVALLGRLHKAGVPIVAGTDGAGVELVHELEIYVQAGFSPAEALAAATIVPARLVGQDAKTGSRESGQDRRSGAHRRRSVDADRRPATNACGNARRQAARCRRAAHGRGILRPSQVDHRVALSFIVHRKRCSVRLMWLPWRRRPIGMAQLTLFDSTDTYCGRRAEADHLYASLRGRGDGAGVVCRPADRRELACGAAHDVRPRGRRAAARRLLPARRLARL